MSLKSLKQHSAQKQIHADLIKILKYVCIIQLDTAAMSLRFHSNLTESYLKNTLDNGRLVSNLESAESNASSDCGSPEGARGVRRVAHAVGARRGPLADPGAPTTNRFQARERN